MIQATVSSRISAGWNWFALFSHHVDNGQDSVFDVRQGFIFGFALTQRAGKFQATRSVASMGLLLKGYMELHTLDDLVSIL